ncbi:MAG: hypothetical protein IH623_00690 [Verrucomicrobia bacterium]|nr:hypothetical protein [Verrucomicrobiota bacterium]
MIKLLQSIWTTSFVGALLFWGTVVMLWQAPIVVPSQANPDAAIVHGDAASWNFHNPEVDLLITELKLERERLAKRTVELNELAERLQAERLELNQVTQMVNQLQVEFDLNVVRVTTEEAANVKRLARTYAAMSPEGAAAILKQLDETTLVKILANMKESEIALLLEAIGRQSEAEARRVAGISERLRLSLPNPKEVKRRP